VRDPNRPFVFCSVYKMEDRKGWKELVSESESSLLEREEDNGVSVQAAKSVVVTVRFHLFRRCLRVQLEAYATEFTAKDNVLLLLRTYLHLMGDLKSEVYNRTQIYM